MTHSEKSETQIRERAYHIWEEAGRPDGQADLHWFLAMQEVFASPPMTTPDPAPAKAKAKIRAKKATTAEATSEAAPARKASAKKPAKKAMAAKPA